MSAVRRRLRADAMQSTIRSKIQGGDARRVRSPDVATVPGTVASICANLRDMARSQVAFLLGLILLVSKLDLEDDPTCELHIFPKFAIWGLMLLTFWSRYLIVNGDDGLGVLHPEEHHQAIEVAHSEVYGYGFRPCGFLVPSAAAATHHRVCHTALNSWIPVRFYVTVFRCRDSFQWSRFNPFMVARLVHAMVAACLPFCVYQFSRTVFRQCRDVAFMSALLVAFSKHLMLCGTHPFIQSLLSPVTFLSLTITLRTVGGISRPWCDTDVARQHAEGGRESDSVGLTQPHDTKTVTTAAAAPPSGDVGRNFKTSLTVCGVIQGLLIYIQTDTLLLFVGISLVFLLFGQGDHQGRTQRTSILFTAVGVGVGLLACGVEDQVSYGQWFVTLGQRIAAWRTSDPFGSRLTPTHLYSILSSSHVNVVLTGAAVLMTALHWTHGRRWPNHRTSWAREYEWVLNPTAKLTTLSAVMLLWHSTHGDSKAVKGGHVIYDTLVVLLVAGAAAAYVLFRTVYLYIVRLASANRKTRNVIKLALYGELLLYMFEARVTYPSSANGTIGPWTYDGHNTSSLINRCLHHVGRQDDVTGVVIDYPVEMTGGYTLLHHNVPIVARTHSDFREWDPSVSWRVAARGSILRSILQWAFPRSPALVNFTTMDDVTDFISVRNAALLAKRVAERRWYNYLILTGDHKFLRKGFRQVFNASDVRVFKRLRSRIESQALEEMAARIPIGRNATVLEYESSWLVALGLHEKAIERLQQALDLNTSSVRVWQLMSLAHRLSFHDAESERVLSECMVLHGATCDQPVQNAHAEYEGLTEDSWPP